MKINKIIVLALLLCVAGAAKAQFVVSDPAALVQGIVNSSNEMVQTSSSAATMLKSFAETQKIYRQGKEYYDKLRAVSGLVRDARKVQQCVLIVGEISEIYVTSYEKMLTDTHFSSAELSAIARGYTKLLQQSTGVLKDLQVVVNPTDLSMTDKDRLDVIDKSYGELVRLRNLTGTFTRSSIGVAVGRARKANDMRRTLSLYGADEDKYW